MRKSRKHLFRAFKRDLVFGGIALFFIVVSCAIFWVASFKIPDLQTLEDRRINQSTKIYDRTGKILLYDVHSDIRRTIVPLNQISVNLKNATVAIEDAEFYQHHGIKISSIFRAIFANIGTFGYGQGGSTITQQVVKNSILTKDKTLSRKLKEWVLSLKLERIMDKNSILALYLNESPYGGNIYGAEEASQAFFHKKSADLDVAESAYLASLPNAPTYYSPYGNNKEKLVERKNLVLQRMLENKFITEDEYTKARAEEVVFQPQEVVGIKAPHFVLFIKEYLENKYGTQAILDGGLKVITTLDYGLEKTAEEIVKKYALENAKNFNASNASLVAIDPKTGQILVMVGSRDYFDKEIDGNFNVTIAHRQPGSSFKPFVYATAFEKGYTPDTKVFDLETEFSSECNPDGTPIISGNKAKCYMPQNYDGLFRGPISLRNALAQSINIPAIKVLYLAGIKDSLETVRSMGITSLIDQNRYGLTLVLGGGEVSPLEMTSAYSVFANNGVRNPYQGILEVYDKDGNILEKFEPHGTQVIPENIALQISDILSDNKARIPAYGDHSPLYFPGRDVAAKTGTTNDYKDAWILGYTTNLAVGAWAGNNDNSPMEKKVAGFIIAPMWNAFMQEALKQFPNEKFKKLEEISEPEKTKPVLRGFWQGNDSYFVDTISGKLATVNTPPETKEERVVKNIHSILYWINKKDPLGAKPANPDDDSQFKLWEYPIRKWVENNHIQEEDTSVVPRENETVHTPESAPHLTITNISPNQTYNHTEKVSLSILTSGAYPLKKADLYINERYVSSIETQPFMFSFIPDSIPEIKTQNTLKVVGYDSVFNKGETTVDFSVSF